MKATNGNGKHATNGHSAIENRVIPISLLTPHSRNYQRHPESQIADLQTSLREFSQVRSIVAKADKRGKAFTVIAGHGILEAAKREGYTKLKVDVIPASWSETKALAYLAADNSLSKFADPDEAQLAQIVKDVLEAEGEVLARLAAGEQAALDALLAQGNGSEPKDAEPQTDKAKELQAKWNTAQGQLWEIGNHLLLIDDSTKRENVARVMNGEIAECVFTSPPYAVGMDYGETYEDTIQNLREMLPKLSEIWLETVCAGGFAVINFGDIASGRAMAGAKDPCEYPMALEYFPVFRHDGWLLWSRRIWCKPTARVPALWAIQSNRAATDFEHIWTWRKAGKAIIGSVKGSVVGWFDSTKLLGVDVGKDTHGAGMPVGVGVRMIAIHSRAGGIVHEPFTGTGTTLVACENLGRKTRALEISPAYAAVTLQRMSDAFGLTPKRIESGNNGTKAQTRGG